MKGLIYVCLSEKRVSVLKAACLYLYSTTFLAGKNVLTLGKVSEAFRRIRTICLDRQANRVVPKYSLMSDTEVKYANIDGRCMNLLPDRMPIVSNQICFAQNLSSKELFSLNCIQREVMRCYKRFKIIINSYRNIQLNRSAAWKAAEVIFTSKKITGKSDGTIGANCRFRVNDAHDFPKVINSFYSCSPVFMPYN